MLFTSDQTSRLTQLSLKQLRYWDTTEFFTPVYRGPERHAFNRLYSFRDVVGLRAIARLLAERVSLPELRKVGAYLKQFHETPWASLRLGLRGSQRKIVCFFDPISKRWTSTRPGGQLEMSKIIAMREVATDIRERVATLQRRSADQKGKISQQRRVAHNAPVVAGTRVPTSAIWNFHEAGYAAKQIQEQYPTLTLEDIRAALVYERKQRKRAS